MANIKSSDIPFVWGCVLFSKNLDIIYADDSIYSIFDISDNEKIKNIVKEIFVNHTENETGLKKLELFPARELFYSLRPITMGNRKLYHLIVSDYTGFNAINENMASLLDENHYYNHILNNLPDGVYIADEKGVTLYVNDSFLELSGLKRETLINENLRTMVSEGRVPTSNCLEVIKSKKPVSSIIKYYSGKDCLVSGTPVFDSKGKLKRVVSIIRDVSELQKLRSDLEKTASLSSIYERKLNEMSINATDTINTKNKQMEEIYSLASSISNVDSTILLTGESGVGKDFFANYIHKISSRKNAPFLKINCSAIPEHLLESELFGYEPGAFTGASQKGKPGLFEVANNGTLFLDEIGEMPYPLQAKLLAVLQDKKMYRIGGSKAINIDARIIAATNVDLEQLIAEKKFRLDLYYRLNVINFEVPPLRERKEDIVFFSNTFLNEFNNKYGKCRYFSPELYNAFLNYGWPGNIREMKNIIERLVIIAKENLISDQLFYDQIMPSKKTVSTIQKDESDVYTTRVTSPVLKKNLEDYEIYLLRSAIVKHKTLSDAANALGIDLSTLVRKKKKYGL
ncbi:MAG: PAS domain S-box protein [Lachnospiraceae bacterium]|nr:PAS domain S-box protein [Lachnospiraceae bacterium]